MTKREAHDLSGRQVGPWKERGLQEAFTETLRDHLGQDRIEELDLHVNDTAFADACVDRLLEMMKGAERG
jgi:uncharacterized protein (UPF0261 family)